MSEPSNLSVLSANNSASITSMSTPFNLPPSKFQIQDTLTEKANVTAITPTSCQQSFTVRHQRRDLNQPFELHVPSLPYPFVGSGVILHFNPSTTSNNVSGTLAPKNFRTGTQDTLDGLFASPPFIPFSDIAASLPHDVRLSHLSSASVPPNTYLTAAFRSEFLDHIDVPSEFQYRFDADLKTCSNKNEKGSSVRASAEFLCTYPGVSWNSRMQSWLVYYEDMAGRKSKTFNPKRFTASVIRKDDPCFERLKDLDPMRIAMHCACAFAAKTSTIGTSTKALPQYNIITVGQKATVARAGCQRSQPTRHRGGSSTRIENRLWTRKQPSKFPTSVSPSYLRYIDLSPSDEMLQFALDTPTAQQEQVAERLSKNMDIDGVSMVKNSLALSFAPTDTVIPIDLMDRPVKSKSTL